MAHRLVSICACLLLLSFAVALPARGTTIRVEAETYYAFNQVAGCGYPVVRWACSQASGGYAVEGIDCDGEWIKIHLSMSSRLTFYTALRSAGEEGYVRHFGIRYSFDNTEETPLADLSFVTLPGGGVT